MISPFETTYRLEYQQYEWQRARENTEHQSVNCCRFVSEVS